VGPMKGSKGSYRVSKQKRASGIHKMRVIVFIDMWNDV